ncbi:MAG TPA: ATP-grasp domain-containing protein [Candidatus Acidoferrales bacterium]|nr:ATP-grasp domain-containing protein [Candidatus Acidoferrales bacterium]
MRILVLDGNQNQAVAAVRSLAGAGHMVLAGDSTSWNKAGWSRFARETFRYPSPQGQADAFVSRIAEVVAAQPGTLVTPTLVMPMTEATTLSLSAHRERIFSAGGCMVLPAHEQVLRAFDKQQTTELARSLGIAVPRTILVDNRDEAERAARSLEYPVVLKPRASEELGKMGNVRTGGRPQYASTLAEFQSAYAEISGRSSGVLVQQYVEGEGTGYFALMHNGELRAEFAHRRIRDVYPTGSGSAVRVSVEPEPEIRRAGVAILEALRWHGVAMVEFRWQAGKPPVFMEVNGRFWHSLPLACYAGVDFPALLAQMAEHGDVPLAHGYRSGVRCRWFLGDLRHLIEVWKGPPPGYPGPYPGRFRTLASVFKPVPGTVHDLFLWTDPLPELGDWLDFARRIVQRGRQ